jgi:hypothetical protein
MDLKNAGQIVTCIGNYGMRTYPAIIERDASNIIHIYNTANQEFLAISQDTLGSLPAALQLWFLTPVIE